MVFCIVLSYLRTISLFICSHIYSFFTPAFQRAADIWPLVRGRWGEVCEGGWVGG